MPVIRTAYRGYRIEVFGAAASWHFSATPMTPDLPILSRSAFAAAGLMKHRRFLTRTCGSTYTDYYKCDRLRQNCKRLHLEISDAIQGVQ